MMMMTMILTMILTMMMMTMMLTTIDSYPLPVKLEELPGFDPRSRLRFCFFSSDTFTVTSVKGNK